MCLPSGWSGPLCMSLTAPPCTSTGVIDQSQSNAGRHCRHEICYLMQEGVRNRTEPAEPNRTVIQFWKRPEPDAEPNRTEMDRATTRPKSAGRTASNREIAFSEPKRTKPMNSRQVRNRNESNRTGSFL